MAIRGCKTIAEYAIRRWLVEQGFVAEYFDIEFKGSEAVLADNNGHKLQLVYDHDLRLVYEKEREHAT
ncbi:hypothetical protein [Acetatifactor aquisgranensis]|uniref:hypothetical protein n=1 Tax=Acetatifactor aquisgranensis TaxID=2941233 RepID=UPI00203C6988|nr:hypothetical protein [Acetatifactor aquisgranensis]